MQNPDEALMCNQRIATRHGGMTMFTDMKIALAAAIVLGVLGATSAACAEWDNEGQHAAYQAQSWQEIPHQNQYRMGDNDDAYGSFGPPSQQEDLSQSRKGNRSH
jgi:hypothetical protein